MELLILLLTRQGSLVTRDEIAASLWPPGVFVDVNMGINTLIRKIRYALRDNAEQPRYIETVSGKGYRFVSKVVIKVPVNGFPVNGANAPAAAMEAPSISSSHPPPAPPQVPSRVDQTRRFVWSGIACIGILAVAAVTSHWLHNRPRHVEYTQLTNFADSASAPSLSPDGHMLAFIRGSNAFSSSDQIYVKTLPSGEPKRLTNDLQWKYSPVFSPDGSQIAYTMLAGKVFQTRLIPVFGGESRVLLNNAAGLTWLSPDEVLFSRVRDGLHMGVMIGELGEQQFRDLYFPANKEEMAHYTIASPDHRAAVVVQMAADKSWTQCRLISIDHRFPWRFVGPEGSCNAAAWSPDGSWMYFTVEKEGTSHLWRQPYPNGAPEQITFGPAEEEGVAMEPGGESIITSFGVRQTSLWLHQPGGDRALVMEGQILGGRTGEWYSPSFSRDGKFIYYLLQRAPGLKPELSRVDVNSGESNIVLPGVSMHDYDISADGKRVLYSCSSSRIPGGLCIASLDGNSTPRRIPVPNASFPHFGTPGELFFVGQEGNSRYLEESKEDGSSRHKLLPSPVFDYVLISPARRWLLTPFLLQGSDVQFKAVSLRGDAPKTYCSTPCYPYWSPDGKWLYVPVEHASGANPGRSLAIPIGPDETLPEFPAGGIQPGAKPSGMPGSLSITRDWVIPSNNPAQYAYLTVNTQRNLYRLSLP